MNNKKYVIRLAASALAALTFATAAHAMEAQPEGAAPRIDFRAAGSDPPWLFELERPGGIRFIAEGRTTVVAPARDFSLNPAHSGVIYGHRGDSQELLAEIVQISCSDSISGEKLSHTVTIRRDNREYHGCGKRIRGPEAAGYASVGEHEDPPSRQ